MMLKKLFGQVKDAFWTGIDEAFKLTAALDGEMGATMAAVPADAIIIGAPGPE